VILICVFSYWQYKAWCDSGDDPFGVILWNRNEAPHLH